MNLRPQSLSNPVSRLGCAEFSNHGVTLDPTSVLANTEPSKATLKKVRHGSMVTFRKPGR
jgi:hypothetical protein